uniref:IRF tryptophan pentad repeat domain-containing protein n=1 Tax=Microcebus murinus TaxID=30608 RepID=A0A8C5XMC4_MICMU
MCDRNGGRRLRQWLIEQIDSGMYPGLIWENDEKSMFRIPWKHAGKQDYNQEVDASIFKAWAVFKGKFKEGDKAEPATWKTRLRCALNKSPDFEEVTDRSQLDISEPYKVYRIVPEEEQKCNYPSWAHAAFQELARARGPRVRGGRGVWGTWPQLNKQTAPSVVQADREVAPR